MSNFNNDIVLDSNLYYSIIMQTPIKNDDSRNESLYRYMANIDNLLDTREDDKNIIPVSQFDKTGGKNCVLMSNNNTLVWQEVSKKVQGQDRIVIAYDESFTYYGYTMEAANFNWIDNVTVTSTRIFPGVQGGRITTKLVSQATLEQNWKKLYSSTLTEHTLFTKTREYTENGKKYISFNNKKNNFDLLGGSLVDTNGKVVDVVSVKNIKANEIYSDVRDPISVSSYTVSVILDDGSVYNWGAIGTTDFLPPANIKSFKQLSASTYAHLGLTIEGNIYGWGYNTVTCKRIIDGIPLDKKFVYCTTGFDFGIGITDTYDLIHWGGTSVVAPIHLPPRYTSKTEGMADRSADDFVKVVGGFKVAGALRRDGRLHIFGAADYYSLLADAPTFDDIVDFDLEYRTGVYLRRNGVVGQWGTNSYAIPSFGTDTIIKVKGDRYIHQAITSQGKIYTWGSSALVNVIGAVRNNVIESATFNYIGAYITSDYSIKPFTKVATTSPEAPVNNLAPASTVKSRAGGLIIESYDLDFEISDSLGTNEFYVMTNTLGYHTLSGDYRDETVMVMLQRQEVKIVASNTLQVTYKTVDINTNKLTFFWKSKTEYEVATKLNFDLDSLRIGQ